MSYSYNSEVYFAVAICPNAKINVKIGQTTNTSRRNNQLWQEDFHIIKTAAVYGDYAERLFVESYLRAKINAIDFTEHYRTDYFSCSNQKQIDWLANKFFGWVEEANTILLQMKTEFKPNRPTPPPNRELIYNEIWDSLEKYQYYEIHEQCDTATENEFLNFLKTYFMPFGYTCSSRRNYSWCYFEVKKVA